MNNEDIQTNIGIDHAKNYEDAMDQEKFKEIYKKSNDVFITYINKNKILFAFQDRTNNNFGTCLVATINENNNKITYGIEYIFNKGNTEHIKIIKLKNPVSKFFNNSFLIIFNDQEKREAVVTNKTITYITK